MKNNKTRISANEINRFVYCPYQWYYNRYYGATVLNQKFKELESSISEHEAHFVKGMNHHKQYYLHYRLKKLMQLMVLLALLLVLAGMVIEWYM